VDSRAIRGIPSLTCQTPQPCLRSISGRRLHGLASLTMAGVTRATAAHGVLRPHVAQDGGRGTDSGFRAAKRLVPRLGRLSQIAQKFGSRDVQLTSRAQRAASWALPDPCPRALITCSARGGLSAVGHP
jgi:hypothetical protein